MCYTRGDNLLWVRRWLGSTTMYWYLCICSARLMCRCIRSWISHSELHGCVNMIQHTLSQIVTAATLWACRVCWGVFRILLARWSREATLCRPLKFSRWEGSCPRETHLHLLLYRPLSFTLWTTRSVAGAFSIYSQRLIPADPYEIGAQYFPARVRCLADILTLAFCWSHASVGRGRQAGRVGRGGFAPCCRGRAAFDCGDHVDGHLMTQSAARCCG